MKIAVSGSIGSGKSTVCLYLREKGYDVFDCDEVNRALLKEGEAGWLAVKEAFPDCFDSRGLNKQKLSFRIFNDEEEKRRLEGIMHPLILDELNKRQDDPLFAEVPLLFEAGWEVFFDHNLLVVTDFDLLIERLAERGVPEDEAIRRLSSQMDISEKIKRADKIIYNNGSLTDLYRLVDDWLAEIL